MCRYSRTIAVLFDISMAIYFGLHEQWAWMWVFVILGFLIGGWNINRGDNK